MSEKLADILARKKAARAAAAGDNNSAGPETTRSPSLGRRQPSAYNGEHILPIFSCAPPSHRE